MISEFMTSLAGASWLPPFFLIAAVVCFVAVIVWVIRLDKRVVSELERLPLDSSENELHQGEERHV